jgi:hypothetical protein
MCGAKTLVTGWPWCETCASGEDARKQLSISVLADAIVEMEQRGITWLDQREFMIAHGINKQRIEAAQAAVLDRYRAIEMRRPRASRGW